MAHLLMWNTIMKPVLARDVSRNSLDVDWEGTMILVALFHMRPIDQRLG